MCTGWLFRKDSEQPYLMAGGIHWTVCEVLPELSLRTRVFLMVDELVSGRNVGSSCLEFHRAEGFVHKTSDRSTRGRSIIGHRDNIALC